MRLASLFLLLFLLLLAGSAGWAHAELIYDYGQPFADDSGPKPLPGGAAPWLRATFVNVTDSSVRLTLEGVNLPDEQFASEFYFNFHEDLNPSLLSLVHEGGLTAVAVETGVDAFKSDGDGYYDVEISFDTDNSSGNRFVDGSFSEYLVSYGGTLPVGTDFAGLFVCLSTAGGGCGPYYTASHIQNIPDPPCKDDSTWVHGDPPSPSVPEPAGMALWTLSAVMGLVGRWRGRP